MDVLRLDLIHPLYGGNKLFKLYENYNAALSSGQKKVLTFGGAHSNHIYAASAFLKEKGMNSVGVIRGREEEEMNSPTLIFARKNGMHLHYVSNADYQKKTSSEFHDKLRSIYGDFYLIPEGGNNREGIMGCKAILNEQLKKYEFVFCACGTSATYAGILLSAEKHQRIIGVSVLKEISSLMQLINSNMKEFGQGPIHQDKDEILNTHAILDGYSFGGYAKFSSEIVNFKKSFEQKWKIELDHVYTAKLFYAVQSLAQKKRLTKKHKILIVHSGGQQGNFAFEKRYQIK